jgi:hypothetical protein
VLALKEVSFKFNYLISEESVKDDSLTEKVLKQLFFITDA